MFNQYISTELKVYFWWVVTSFSYLLSKLDMDFTINLIKDLIMIASGLTAVIYTIFRILAEHSKRKFYKRIEKERNEKKSL